MLPALGDYNDKWKGIEQVVIAFIKNAFFFLFCVYITWIRKFGNKN